MNWTVSAGTIIGRDHVAKRMNNQDGYAVFQDEKCTVLAVCDGCSSGRFNEVGARWAATWLAHHVRWYTDILEGDCGESERRIFASCVMDGLSQDLLRMLQTMTGYNDIPPSILADYGLFTVMCAVMVPDYVIIFGVGDGSFRVEEDLGPEFDVVVSKDIDSGPGNAPNYIGYRLLSPEQREQSGIQAGNLRPVIHYYSPADKVKALLIGTDGVVDIDKSFPSKAPGHVRVEDMLGEEALYRNKSLLGKRLIVLGELNKLLPDDTTIVMARRQSV